MSDFSIPSFNRSQPALRLVEDTGDDIPSPEDRFVEKKSERPADPEKIRFALDRFYSRQFQKLGASVPAKAGKGYWLGARMAGAPAELQRRFLDHLRAHRLPVHELWSLERTAVARGDLVLGRSLRVLLTEHPQFKQLNKISDSDPWGDPIYLLRGSPSELVWKAAETLLTDEGERRGIANVLSCLLSIDVEGPLSADFLRRLSLEILEYRRRGLPLPPRLRLFQPVRTGTEQTPGGHYHSQTDTVSLPTDWNSGSWAHEWGHFLMDLMDDREGPNPSYFQPRRADGTPLFDPKRCLVWESVSQYGGSCDVERSKSIFAGSKKAEEDPAETFAYLLEEQRGNFYSNARHLNFHAAWFRHRLQAVTYFAEAEEKDLDPAALRTWLESAKAFVAFSGKDLPPPPAPRKRDPGGFLLALDTWRRKIETETLPAAQQMRKEKLTWGQGVLKDLETGAKPLEIAARSQGSSR